MDSKNNKMLGMKPMLMMFAMIPFVVAVITMAVLSANLMTNNVEKNIRDELKVASQGLRGYYEYDLINDNDLVDGFLEYNPEAYIDGITKETGVFLTVFKGDTRFMTSIRDDKGDRIEGTHADPKIWKQVSGKKDYYGDGVVINGESYYVYYEPLLGSDGNVVGMTFAGKQANDIHSDERHMYLVIVGIGLILGAVFTIIALMLGKKIADPISEIAKDMELLSNGSVNVDVKATTHIRETAVLIECVQRLAGQLKSSITSIIGRTGDILAQGSNMETTSTENADNIENLSRAVDEIANGASSMAQDVQTAAESVSNVMNTLGNINSSVESTQQATDIMNSGSRKVVEDFDVLIRGTDESINKLKDIDEKMNTVKKAVDDVNNAAEEINDIASQTNLLSLNASIEAARAGEAGRGFAVVAGEISSLSDQSNTAAGTIKEIMLNLERQTMEAVKSVSELSVMMQKQGETSKKSQKSLNELISAIEDTERQVESVKAGSDEVSAVCDKLNEIIYNLSAISEQNAASAEETSASIEQVSINTSSISDIASGLNSVAEDLRDITDFYSV